MDRDTTLILLAAGIGIFAAGWLGERARARAPLAAHALLPWRALLFIGLTATLFAAIHLVSAWST